MNEYLQRIAALILMIMAIPLALIIIAVLAPSVGRQVFYCTRRLGLNTQRFILYKFTTMRPWSEVRFQAYLDQHPEQKKEWLSQYKLVNDPRRLPVGVLLRRFSLDELPQLWNIVKGDMNLIGPRPIVREEDVFYGKYSSQLHSIKPGLTGLWQVCGRNSVSYHRRIAMNLYYIKHRSWKLDCWILYKTLFAVFNGRGAF